MIKLIATDMDGTLLNDNQEISKDFEKVFKELAEPFYKYIIGNNNSNTQKIGIYARDASYNELEIGDIVQLTFEGNAYHTMIITDVVLDEEYLVDYLEAQHTYDLLDYPLSLKEGVQRYIKILGYYS